MGNRAVITDKKGKVGLYLHWNGGRDSVEGFLEYCKRKGCRGFGSDSEYALSRLDQVAGNYIGGTLSVGITTYCKNGEDNGVYVVEGWDIIGRYTYKYNYETKKYRKVKFPVSREQYEYSLPYMLESIDAKQPEEERLGNLLKARLLPVSDVCIGDTIYVLGCRDRMEGYEVLGFGEDMVVNGTNVKGLPYFNCCCGGSRNNPNNYLTYQKEVYVYRG